MKGLGFSCWLWLILSHCPSHCHQGYAYTFITEDQARYAGDIIKALELSGTAVPPDLEKLWSDFKDQQKAVSFKLSLEESLARLWGHYMITVFSFFCFFFCDRVSLCSSGCPRTCHIDQAGFKLSEIYCLCLPNAHVKGTYLACLERKIVKIESSLLHKCFCSVGIFYFENI